MTHSPGPTFTPSSLRLLLNQRWVPSGVTWGSMSTLGVFQGAFTGLDQPSGRSVVSQVFPSRLK